MHFRRSRSHTGRQTPKAAKNRGFNKVPSEETGRIWPFSVSEGKHLENEVSNCPSWAFSLGENSATLRLFTSPPRRRGVIAALAITQVGSRALAALAWVGAEQPAEIAQHHLGRELFRKVFSALLAEKRLSGHYLRLEEKPSMLALGTSIGLHNHGFAYITVRFAVLASAAHVPSKKSS